MIIKQFGVQKYTLFLYVAKFCGHFLEKYIFVVFISALFVFLHWLYTACY